MKRIIAAAGIATLLGGAVACGTQAANQPAASKTSTQASQPAATPKPATTPAEPATTLPPAAAADDALAWMDSGGYDAMMQLSKDLTGISSEPSAAELSAIQADIAACKAHPMPASIDKNGEYPGWLDDLQAMMEHYKSGDYMTALTDSSKVMTHLSSLMDEISAVQP